MLGLVLFFSLYPVLEKHRRMHEIFIGVFQSTFININNSLLSSDLGQKSKGKKGKKKNRKKEKNLFVESAKTIVKGTRY